MLINKIKDIVSKFGPAFYVVGYVIGTGSVTSMIVAGGQYGLTFSWALFLSCLFTYFLLIAIGKLTIASNQPIVHLIKIEFGKLAGLVLIVFLAISVISSVIGIMGIITDLFQLWLLEISSGIVNVPEVVVASFFILILLLLAYKGNNDLFGRIMAFMVASMALFFLFASIIIIGTSSSITQIGVQDNFDWDESKLVLAGLVGTTMAGVVIVSRSVLVHDKKWDIKKLDVEKKDAGFSMTLTFIICMAIMICATGTLFGNGQKVDSVIEMVATLEPLAGNFTTTVFTLGILCAGLSSIFPNLLLLPWLLSDLNGKNRQESRTNYFYLIILVALSGLIIPVFGGNPIWILIASQAVSPFIMPVLTVFLLVLGNNRRITNGHKFKSTINVALILSLIFNLYILKEAILGFIDFYLN